MEKARDIDWIPKLPKGTNTTGFSIFKEVKFRAGSGGQIERTEWLGHSISESGVRASILVEECLLQHIPFIYATDP
jgi:hypothetical protein